MRAMLTFQSGDTAIVTLHFKKDSGGHCAEDIERTVMDGFNNSGLINKVKKVHLLRN